MKFKIETDVFSDGKIHQKITKTDDLWGITDHIQTKIVDTQEKHIREALIKMGWTPPPEQSCSSSPVEWSKEKHTNGRTGQKRSIMTRVDSDKESPWYQETEKEPMIVAENVDRDYSSVLGTIVESKPIEGGFMVAVKLRNPKDTSWEEDE